jgi:hypothetical protein
MALDGEFQMPKINLPGYPLELVICEQTVKLMTTNQSSLNLNPDELFFEIPTASS